MIFIEAQKDAATLSVGEEQRRQARGWESCVRDVTVQADCEEYSETSRMTNGVPYVGGRLATSVCFPPGIEWGDRRPPLVLRRLVARFDASRVCGGHLIAFEIGIDNGVADS